MFLRKCPSAPRAITTAFRQCSRRVFQPDDTVQLWPTHSQVTIPSSLDRTLIACGWSVALMSATGCVGGRFAMGIGGTRDMGSAGVVGVAPAESMTQLRALAERDASRYASEEPVHCRSAKSCKPGFDWPWSVRVGVAALLGVALWFLVPDGAISVASEVRTDSSPGRVDLQSLLHAPVPTTGEHPELVGQATDRLRISRERGVWRIRADAASRHEVARTLAELSGTHLPAGIEALRSTRPLDLRWEGQDLSQAWQAFIGNEANYALKCSEKRCMAWVVASASAPEARRITKALEGAPAPVAAVRRTGRNIGDSESSAYD